MPESQRPSTQSARRAQREMMMGTRLLGTDSKLGAEPTTRMHHRMPDDTNTQ